MASAVLSRSALWRSPVRTARPLEVLPVKRVLSISNLILPLLALASAPLLSAQALVVDKPNLVFNGQVGGSPVSQTINITSSNGSAQNFTLSYPSFSWLKANGQPLGV